MITAKIDYERHKKIREKRNKLELLKRETDIIKYYPNELQIKIVNNEINEIADDPTAIEHEKLNYSMIRKENDDMVHSLLDTRSNASKILSAQQKEHIQNDIIANSQNLQRVIYQNKRN
jgi:hypothetical protein